MTMRLIWHSLLTAIGVLLLAAAPYASPPFDKLLADLGQLSLDLAGAVK
jgi:hypothetical protein